MGAQDGPAHRLGPRPRAGVLRGPRAPAHRSPPPQDSRHHRRHHRRGPAARDASRPPASTPARAISAGEARRLACNAGLIPAVLGGKSRAARPRPGSSGSSTKPNASPLGLVHDTCAADGCERPYAWCELHHRKPWSDGGRTDLRRRRTPLPLPPSTHPRHRLPASVPARRTCPLQQADVMGARRMSSSCSVLRLGAQRAGHVVAALAARSAWRRGWRGRTRARRRAGRAARGRRAAPGRCTPGRWTPSGCRGAPRCRRRPGGTSRRTAPAAPPGRSA